MRHGVGRSLRFARSKSHTTSVFPPPVTSRKFVLLKKRRHLVRPGAGVPHTALPDATSQMTSELSSCPPREARYVPSYEKASSATFTLCRDMRWTMARASTSQTIMSAAKPMFVICPEASMRPSRADGEAGHLVGVTLEERLRVRVAQLLHHDGGSEGVTHRPAVGVEDEAASDLALEPDDRLEGQSAGGHGVGRCLRRSGRNASASRRDASRRARAEKCARAEETSNSQIEGPVYQPAPGLPPASAGSGESDEHPRDQK